MKLWKIEEKLSLYLCIRRAANWHVAVVHSVYIPVLTDKAHRVYHYVPFGGPWSLVPSDYYTVLCNYPPTIKPSCVKVSHAMACVGDISLSPSTLSASLLLSSWFISSAGGSLKCICCTIVLTALSQ